jgi:hypothetical protein
MTVAEPFIMLLTLGIPVACIAWTVTHEELFREPREWCARRSAASRTMLGRKFFYLFTCEYCFSHYVSLFFVAISGFTLLFADWRGYLIAFFSLVWVANVYMTAFGRLRLEMKYQRVEIAAKQETLAHPIEEPVPATLPTAQA